MAKKTEKQKLIIVQSSSKTQMQTLLSSHAQQWKHVTPSFGQMETSIHYTKWKSPVLHIHFSLVNKRLSTTKVVWIVSIASSQPSLSFNSQNEEGKIDVAGIQHLQSQVSSNAIKL